MSKLIVANWKMNGSVSFIDSFFSTFETSTNHTLVVCPPFPYISTVKSKGVIVGAQDCSPHASGAYTGDTSALMSKDLGCDYMILGHSERRQYHNESSESVHTKANTAIAAGLIPIICVGESKEIRESGQHIAIVTQQVMDSIPTESGTYAVAYEPIWAIGTGLTASQDDIAQMHAVLRTILPGVQLLYGGSVNKGNSREIMATANVDGVLIGGASLKPNELMEILKF